MSEPTAEPAVQPSQPSEPPPPGQPAAGGDEQVQQMLADAITAGQFMNRPQPQAQPQQPQSPTPAAPAAPAPQQGAPEGEPDKDWKAEAETWKALARKHENRHLAALGFKSKDELDALRTAAQKYAEIEEAQKTEIQKAAERAQSYEKQLNEVRATNARLLAAATYNIPPDLIDLLGSGADEEINARAEMLAERLKATAPAPAPASQRPVESLTPGAAPASAAPQSPDAWIRALAGRKP